VVFEIVYTEIARLLDLYWNVLKLDRIDNIHCFVPDIIAIDRHH